MMSFKVYRSHVGDTSTGKPSYITGMRQATQCYNETTITGHGHKTKNFYLQIEQIKPKLIIKDFYNSCRKSFFPQGSKMFIHFSGKCCVFMGKRRNGRCSTYARRLNGLRKF